MNKFELFSLIFYAIDIYYDEHPSEELGQFLSEMSPFTFKQICSADPAIYIKFEEFIGDRVIDIESSYEIATDYVKTIGEVELMPAFETMTIQKWVDGCKKYLSSNHKGSDL